MKFAICNEIFQGWKLEETFAHAAKTGYDAVEIAPFTVAKSVTDISAKERQRIRDTAMGAGIAISGIHWVLAQTEGLHLTHPDDSVRELACKALGAIVADRPATQTALEEALGEDDLANVARLGHLTGE